MKLLLDTHVLIWWRDSPEKLSVDAFTAISSTDNEVFLSTVVIWEVQIKLAIKKIELKTPLGDAIDAERKANGFQILPVTLDHAFYIEKLPLLAHKDPFDRMLISQAMVEDMTIVTADRKFGEYDVKLLW